MFFICLQMNLHSDDGNKKPDWNIVSCVCVWWSAPRIVQKCGIFILELRWWKRLFTDWNVIDRIKSLSAWNLRDIERRISIRTLNLCIAFRYAYLFVTKEKNVLFRYCNADKMSVSTNMCGGNCCHNNTRVICYTVFVRFQSTSLEHFL